MLNEAKELGSGKIEIELPDAGKGNLHWQASAFRNLAGDYSGWHLDGTVEIDGTEKNFENIMLNGEMSLNMINLLVMKNRKAREYIVDAAATATGLNGLEVAGIPKAEMKDGKTEVSIASLGCPPAGEDDLAPGTAYVVDSPGLKSLWLFDGENHIVLSSRDENGIWFDRENISTIMNGPARKRGECLYDERTMD